MGNCIESHKSLQINDGFKNRKQVKLSQQYSCMKRSKDVDFATLNNESKNDTKNTYVSTNGSIDAGHKLSNCDKKKSQLEIDVNLLGDHEQGLR